MSANTGTLAERPFRKTDAYLAWVIWGLAAVIFIAGEAIAVLNRTQGNEGWSDTSWLYTAFAFAFATIGALVLSHHPGHLVGWLLYVVGLFFELSFSSSDYGLYTLRTDPGALPFGPEVATLAWIGGTAFFMMTTLLLLLFPDGRPVSPKLKVFIWLGIFASALASLSEWLRPGPLDRPLEAWDNVLGVEGARGILELASTMGLFLVALCGAVGVVSLVIRFRRSEGIQREQLKWITFSAVFFIIAWFIQIIAAATDALSQTTRQAMVGVGVASIPLAAGVAILRYRLYDIDWIINRTLVYVPLTAILAGVYIALTGAMRAILAEGTGSDLTVATTTVVVVAMLTPVKNYLQERVDRRFKDTHDPANELRKLASSTRATVEVFDIERLAQRFLERTVVILEASGAVVRLEPARNGAFIYYGDAAPEPAVTLRLEHEGRDLGTLALGQRTTGRPFSPPEEEALAESAAVLAYLLSLNEAVSGIRGPAISR
jgi:hypothetical protein